MSQPYLAEVRIFGGNFNPRGWLFCNGQLLPIDQNTALFSLLGTIYGGDGRTTFGLPNLQGRAALHPGTGPGLSPYKIGQIGGSDNVTLTTAEMASHSHAMESSAEDGDSINPGNNYFGLGSTLYATPNNLASMNQAMLPNAGSGQAHSNQQPYLRLNFIIAVQGIYPSRS